MHIGVKRAAGLFALFLAFSAPRPVAGQCGSPTTEAGCDSSKYDAGNPSAASFVKLDLLASVPNAWGARQGVHDGYTHTTTLSDGRTQTVEVHGFGECKDAFSIYKNNGTNWNGAVGWCKTPGYNCFMIGNTEVNNLPKGDPNAYFGRCIMDTTSGVLGTGADYELKDYGILTVTLSTPITTSFEITLVDIDGNKYSREAGSVFGIGANGELIQPISITPGSGHAVKTADILPPEGTEVGLDMTGVNARTIEIVEWVGDTSQGFLYNTSINTDDDTGHALFKFANDQIYTLAFVYGFPWSMNDAPGTRIHDSQIGYTLWMDPAHNPTIGCEVGCKEMVYPMSTVMSIIGDGSTGMCRPNVRDSVSYVYDSSAPPQYTCAEKYACSWRATGPTNNAGEVPCSGEITSRLVRTS